MQGSAADTCQACQALADSWACPRLLHLVGSTCCSTPQPVGLLCLAPAYAHTSLDCAELPGSPGFGNQRLGSPPWSTRARQLPPAYSERWGLAGHKNKVSANGLEAL